MSTRLRRAPAPRTSSRRGGAAKASREDAAPAPVPSGGFPILGIGASAGGLEAFTQLLALLPSDTGMAFVLIQHLDPGRPSLLPAALARATEMPVLEVTDGTRVEPNHIYVITPNTDISLRQRVLRIRPRPRSKKPHLAIDHFFRSLAAEEGSHAIGVLLSGTGSDGTEGLRAIKLQGGIAFAQDPADAKFAGMPEQAITAGVVDDVLSIQGLAQALASFSRHPYVAVSRTAAGRAPADAEQGLAERRTDEPLNQMFLILRRATGTDFSDYKLTTIKRRLARRMSVHKAGSLADYVRRLERDPAEVQALYEDVLIHVTGFFRDADTFDTLKRKVLPEIVRDHKDGSPIRIWVAGCSSGEEVYSIAICLLEVLDDSKVRCGFQIFGTDVSAKAIEQARAGIYSERLTQNVSPDRLRRFFVPTEGGHRVARTLRDACVFVTHDMTRDTPFAKLDLISCRNVLIYFGLALQKRVLPVLHYCLKAERFLVLGRTEGVGAFPHLFSPVDKAHCVFRKTGLSPHVRSELPAWQRATELKANLIAPPGATAGLDLLKRVDNFLLDRYAPPGVLVNERMDVVQVRGRTGPYLEFSPGLPNLNLLTLVREGLATDLRLAFRQAKKQSASARREGIVVDGDGGKMVVDLEVAPVTGLPGKEHLYVVLFTRAPDAPAPSAPSARRVPRTAAGAGAATASRSGDGREIARLKAELTASRDDMQSLLEERQRLTNEFTAANEELVSSNEELQSTNEELETAKEELQSSNEELTTVNDEIQIRNQEQSVLNSDLLNILASVDIPIVIVDGRRRVRRFTPRARMLMNLIPSDVGRPIGDIKLKIDLPDLDARITEVIETIAVKETDVRDGDGRWYRMQIRPYRTVDDKLDGVVISLLDIDSLKRAMTQAEDALEYVTSIVTTVRVPLIVLDDHLVVVSANEAFYEAFGGDAAGLRGRVLLEARPGWDVGEFRARLEAILPRRSEFAFELELPVAKGRRRLVAVSGRAIRWTHGVPLVLLTLIDVTERASLLAAAEEARAVAEKANRTKDVFLAMLSHEMRTPLTPILIHAGLLQRGSVGPAEAKSFGAVIERAARMQSELIDDLLDISRIVSGKIQIERRRTDLARVVESAVETVRPLADLRSTRLDVRLTAGALPVFGDAARLKQVVWNLLTNAIKFSPQGRRVRVSLRRSGRDAVIRVSDDGDGIAPEVLPHVFDRFTQGDSSRTRRQGGLGLGLAIVHDLVQLHGGSVRAESRGVGEGATFTVSLPLRLRGSAAGRRADDDQARMRRRPKRASRAGGDARRPAAANEVLRGARVLVADDDAGTRDAIVAMLRASGAEAAAVASAAAARDALSTFRPNVLLCDIAMPDEDGYSLIQGIRALSPARGGLIPAAALTALVTSEDRDRALAAGFQMHLAKPMAIADVCDAVIALRRSSRAPRARPLRKTVAGGRPRTGRGRTAPAARATSAPKKRPRRP